MIHARDLMLGDYVSLNGKPVQISGIRSIEDLVSYTDGANNGEIHAEGITAIPLTGELLTKCGFRELGETVFVPKEWNKGSCAIKKERSFFVFVVNDNQIGINFLHELQHAYFMLIKKHLPVCL